MTDLLSRPLLRVDASEPPPRRPTVTSALLAVLAVAAAGLVVCVAGAVAGWFAGDSGTVGGAMQAGGMVWLVANGGGLHVGDVAFTAAPLGSVALAGWLLFRAGRWAGSVARVPTWREAATGAAVMGLGYGGVGIGLWFATRSADVQADPVRAAAVLAVLAATCGGLGLLVGSGLFASMSALLPEPVRAGARGAVAGVLVMVAAGACLVVAALAVNFALATRLAENLDSGLVGGVLLTLLGAALVPNAVLYAGAYIAGPGFAVGAGTAVSPAGVHVGRLPDFPLLAALPTGPPGTWQTVLIAVPVIAGMVAGVVSQRWYPVFAYDRAALHGGLSGLAGGVAFAGLVWCAGGAVGPGRLQEFGPDAVGVLAVCSVAFLLGGAVVAGGNRLLSGRIGDAARRFR